MDDREDRLAERFDGEGELVLGFLPEFREVLRLISEAGDRVGPVLDVLDEGISVERAGLDRSEYLDEALPEAVLRDCLSTEAVPRFEQVLDLADRLIEELGRVDAGSFRSVRDRLGAVRDDALSLGQGVLDSVDRGLSGEDR